jgi:hypothetical protein
MKIIDLLEKNENATNIIRDWYLEKMMTGFEDKNVPEDFKKAMKEKGITNDALSKMIDGVPRILFDVFDENNVIIQINTKNSFSYSINGGEIISGGFNTRKEAELAAIEQAFELLEKKIKETNNEENNN